MKKAMTFLFSATLVLAVSTQAFSSGQSEKSAAAGGSSSGVTLTALMEGHPTTDAIKVLLPKFEKETGIKVNIEVLPYADLTAKATLTMSQRSDQYDVYFDDTVHGVGYAHQNGIAPLDQYVGNPKVNRFVNLKDFVPGYLKQGYFDGKLYGLPMYGESTFLMYRKDLFDKYGIAVPKTMAELMNAAKTIMQKTDGKTYGITLRGQQGIQVVYVWAGFLWGFGGQWFNSNGKADLDSPQAIAATKFYRDLLSKYGPPGFANFGWVENRNAFDQGKAAMTIDATVNGAYNEDPSQSSVVGKVGYAPVPVAQGVAKKGGNSSVEVHDLYVSNYSKHKDAAFEFISWATSQETQIEAFKIKPNSGATSLGALHSPAFQAKYGAFVNAMLEALKNGNPNYLPHVPQSNEIINRTGVALSQVLAGTQTAEAALKSLNDYLNSNVLTK